MIRGYLNLSKLSDVIIYPFFECNLSCVGCPAKKPFGGKVGFLKCNPLDFERHIDFKHIEKILTWNVRNFVILGGEPFLSEAMPMILNDLSSSNRSKVIVYTNATLLYNRIRENGFRMDEKMHEVLNYIDTLIVSIEGGKDWTDRIRGKGVYNKASFIIDALRDVVNIIVRMSYFKYNAISVLEEVKLLNELGIKTVLFPRIGEQPLNTRETELFYKAIASFDNADILLPSYKNFLGLNEYGVSCPAGWAKVCILPDGSITPCQWNFEVVAHLDWRDRYIEQAFWDWYQKSSRIRTQCLSCKYAVECRGSCRAAKDYLFCPVRTGGELEDGRIEIFGEVREISKKKIVAKMRKIEGLVLHGCTAAC